MLAKRYLESGTVSNYFSIHYLYIRACNPIYTFTSDPPYFYFQCENLNAQSFNSLNHLGFWSMWHRKTLVNYWTIWIWFQNTQIIATFLKTGIDLKKKSIETSKFLERVSVKYTFFTVLQSLSIKYHYV